MVRLSVSRGPFQSRGFHAAKGGILRWTCTFTRLSHQLVVQPWPPRAHSFWMLTLRKYISGFSSVTRVPCYSQLVCVPGSAQKAAQTAQILNGECHGNSLIVSASLWKFTNQAPLPAAPIARISPNILILGAPT